MTHSLSAGQTDDQMGQAITLRLCKKLGFTPGEIDEQGNFLVTTPELAGAGKFNAFSSEAFGAMVLMLPLTVLAPDFTEDGLWQVASSLMDTVIAGNNPHNLACAMLLNILDVEDMYSPAFLTLLKANMAGMCTPENHEVLNAMYDECAVVAKGAPSEEVNTGAVDNVIPITAPTALH